MNVRNTSRKENGGRKGIAVSVWGEQHARAFLASLGQLMKNPVGNLFSTAVIGIALALPAGFYLVLNNAENVLQSWEGNIQIALYLRPEIDDEQAIQVKDRLEQLDTIESITFISREQALEEYKTLSGFAEALDALEENPLPGMLLVQPRFETLSGQRGEALLQQLSDVPEVESAQLDRQWVKRLFVLITILERAVIILATLLSVAVLLIVGNTIRLSIINKRTEIEINKLFGATNAFIQRPFLYSGLIYGICGSLLSWVLLLIAALIMQGPVNELAALYNSDFRLQGLGPLEFLVLTASGGGLGLLGSWIAVGRHLRDMEPV